MSGGTSSQSTKSSLFGRSATADRHDTCCDVSSLAVTSAVCVSVTMLPTSTSFVLDGSTSSFCRRLHRRQTTTLLSTSSVSYTPIILTQPRPTERPTQRHYNTKDCSTTQQQPPFLRPLYRSTCISRHLQLTTGRF